MTSRSLSPAACLALFLLCSCSPEAAPAPQDNTATVADTTSDVRMTVQTDAGPRHFTMELARTDAEQERGLMKRETLPPDHGMLFPFPLPMTASFWMKDTPLALDLVFIRPDGSIAAILPGKPNDLHPISAGEPVSAVAEIAGGTAQRLGIAVGQQVTWGDCSAPGKPAGLSADRSRFCPVAP
jgi:uncharacterized membrane protein (UPF0127 family)